MFTFFQLGLIEALCRAIPAPVPEPTPLQAMAIPALIEGRDLITLAPNGTGKKIRVAAFAQGAKLEEAKQAGADVYGFEDLAEAIQKGRLDFDVVVATPDAMRVLGKLGQILGPRGLMPNPKVGTVTLDIAQAVKNAKSGQIRFRTDKKNGIVHCPVGRVDFDADKIRENLAFLLNEIRRLKPSSSKGIYLKSVVLSSTMGPGLLLDLSSLSV